MLERSPRDEVLIAVLPALPAWRPLVFFLSVGLTIAGLVWLAVIALSPGGLGAVEASTAGLLVALGISFDVATAVALMQRLADKVLNGIIGWICYAFARRRYNLTAASLFQFRMPATTQPEPSVAAG